MANRIFKVIVIFINMTQRSEYSVDTLYKAANKKEAVLSGLRWVECIQKNVCPDHNILCLYVRNYAITPINENGKCGTMSTDWVFDWRGGRSSLTLEQAIKNLDKNIFCKDLY